MGSHTFYQRKFISIPGLLSGFEPYSFSIGTYNILADKAIPEGTYTYVDKEIRYMENRHSRIVNEVMHYSPDIICMQEVQYGHYSSLLNQAMYQEGYSGEFASRRDDLGLAIFYKSALFELVHSDAAEAHDLAMSIIKDCQMDVESDDAIRHFIDRPIIAMFARLKFRDCEACINLANIHVVWDDLVFPMVQTLQLCAAVRGLVEFSGGCAHYAHILCGDFNSVPSHPAHQMLREGRLSLDEVEHSLLYAESSVHNNTKLVEMIGKHVTHDARLNSSYLTVMGAEPEITSYDIPPDGDKHGPLCLDYIYYNPDRLVPVSILETPSREVLLSEVSLPNTCFPSDHLLMMTRFQWLPDAK